MTVLEPATDRLLIDQEPVRLRITGTPFLVLTTFGYQAAVPVMHLKAKKEHHLLISALSIAKPLDQLRQDNRGSFIGLEFWIYKSGPAQKAAYVVEE